MAFLPESEKDKEDKNVAGGTDQQLGGAPSAFTADAPSTGNATQTSDTAAPKPTRSGSYTNLMSYVQANTGADGRMGQAVRNSVDNKANEATGKLDSYTGAANSAIGAGTVQQDPSTFSNLASDPTKVDANKFNQQYNASYTGPQNASDIDGYNTAHDAFGVVGDKAAQAGGDLSARSGLVKDAFNRPSYSRGEQRLDGFLVGTGQQGQQSLNQLQNDYSNFGGNFTRGVNSVQSNIAAGQAATDATKQAAHTAYDQAATGSRAAIDGAQAATAAKNQANQAAYQGLITDISSNDPSKQNTAWTKLGVDPAEGRYLLSQGLDINTIVQQGKAQTLGDVANSKDMANYQALRGLLGLGSEYDFTKSGSDGSAYTADQSKVADIKSLQDLMKGVSTKTQQQNQSRGAEYDQLAAALRNSTADKAGIASGWGPEYVEQKLGLPPGYLYQMKSLGIDPASFLKRGGALNEGDVASADEAGQYSNLASLLGIKNDPRFATSGAGKSGAYTYDQAGMEAAIAKAKSDAAAKAAAAAAADATNQTAADAFRNAGGFRGKVGAAYDTTSQTDPNSGITRTYSNGWVTTTDANGNLISQEPET